MGHLFCVNCSVPLQIPGYLPEHTGITQTLFLELIGGNARDKSMLPSGSGYGPTYFPLLCTWSDRVLHSFIHFAIVHQD